MLKFASPSSGAVKGPSSSRKLRAPRNTIPSAVLTTFEDIDSHLQDLYATQAFKISYVSLATGVGAGSWMLQVPGSSSTILECSSPYHREATDKLLAEEGIYDPPESRPERGYYASQQMAQNLALAAYRRSCRLLGRGVETRQVSKQQETPKSDGSKTEKTPMIGDVAFKCDAGNEIILGVGTSGALTSNYDRKGLSQCYVCVCVKNYVHDEEDVSQFDSSLQVGLVTTSQSSQRQASFSLSEDQKLSFYHAYINLAKGRRTRREEDYMCSRLVIDAICDAASVIFSSHAAFSNPILRHLIQKAKEKSPNFVARCLSGFSKYLVSDFLYDDNGEGEYDNVKQILDSMSTNFSSDADGMEGLDSEALDSYMSPAGAARQSRCESVEDIQLHIDGELQGTPQTSSKNNTTGAKNNTQVKDSNISDDILDLSSPRNPALDGTSSEEGHLKYAIPADKKSLIDFTELPRFMQSFLDSEHRFLALYGVHLASEPKMSVVLVPPFVFRQEMDRKSVTNGDSAENGDSASMNSATSNGTSNRCGTLGSSNRGGSASREPSPPAPNSYHRKMNEDLDACEERAVRPASPMAVKYTDRPLVWVSGSFNPFHKGHQAMGTAACSEIKSRTGRRGIIAYELSVKNADKFAIEATDIAQRVSGILVATASLQGSPGSGTLSSKKTDTWTSKDERQYVLITKDAPLFTQKAELVSNVSFVVGTDTSSRILDPKYYSNDKKEMIRTLTAKVGRQKSEFLVAGRTNKNGQFETFLDQDIPDEIVDLFKPMDKFFRRIDISSTEIREGKKEAF